MVTEKRLTILNQAAQRGTIIQGGGAAESQACVKREIWAIQVKLLAALGGDLAASCDVFVLRPFTLPIFHRNIEVLAHYRGEGLILTLGTGVGALRMMVED